MTFVADDLTAWLIGLLADAGRKRLITAVLGDEQQRALRQAATAAVMETAEGVSQYGPEHVQQIAAAISKAFRGRAPQPRPTGQATLLESLHAQILQQLETLNVAASTGTWQPTSSVPDVPVTVLADQLTGHLVREVLFRGSQGGPLTPLASQLNHDLSRLQATRIEGILADLVRTIREMSARTIDSDHDASTGHAQLPVPPYWETPGFRGDRESLEATWPEGTRFGTEYPENDLWPTAAQAVDEAARPIPQRLLVLIIILRARARILPAMFYSYPYRTGEHDEAMALFNDLSQAQDQSMKIDTALSRVLGHAAAETAALVRDLAAGYQDSSYDGPREYAQRHDEHIEMLCRILGAIPLNACGADLSDLDVSVTDPERRYPGLNLASMYRLDPLASTIWDDATVWPKGYRSEIMRQSAPLRPGVYQVSD